MAAADYRHLKVWQQAIELIAETHLLADRLPAPKASFLADQLRRAAVSVAANIAEGNGRPYRRDYVRHLSVANGSLKEVETYIHICERLGYATPEQLERARALSESVGRMLVALGRSLASAMPPERPRSM